MNGQDNHQGTRRWSPTTVTAAWAFALVTAMFGAAYASVPLYQLFCKVTGYAGTPKVLASNDGKVLDRVIKVRFDSNVAPKLGWKFKPVQKDMVLKVGEDALAFYRAENTSDKPIVGTAVFNIAPAQAASYFNKVECFCYTEQRLEPGESKDMPVTFFIDPDIDKDSNLKTVTTITLSYTFFPAKNQPKTTAANGGKLAPAAKGNEREG